MTNKQGRLAISVGYLVDDKARERPNKKDLRESYVTQTLTRGYRAYLRHDGCEGRRFQHFIEKGSEFAEEDLRKPVSRPVAVKRLRKLERRGMLLAAVLDMVPSLFHSCWMVLSYKR